MGSKQSKIQSLVRKKLDEKLRSPAFKQLSPPNEGWVKTIRRCLGMTQSHLANRLGITKQSLSQFEKSEMSGTATIQSMQKIAQAMGCEFKYVFVPKNGLEAFIQAHAKELASKIVEDVNVHMNLEGQATTKEYQKQRIDELTQELIKSLDKRIWDSDAEK